MFDPRDDARDRDGREEGRARMYDERDRDHDPREGLMHRLDLPRGEERELVAVRTHITAPAARWESPIQVGQLLHCEGNAIGIHTSFVWLSAKLLASRTRDDGQEVSYIELPLRDRGRHLELAEIKVGPNPVGTASANCSDTLTDFDSGMNRPPLLAPAPLGNVAASLGTEEPLPAFIA
jgi:hypothetical protein